MPFTPFHLGPALLFGFLLFRFIDFPTFLVANVIADLEPFAVLLLGLGYPLHGFFHSFIGGTMVAVVLGFVMFRLSSIAAKVMRPLRLEQRSSLRRTMAAAILGVYLHILLDSPLYADIKPFYPLDINPFFGQDTIMGMDISTFCALSFLAGAVIFIIKLRA